MKIPFSIKYRPQIESGEYKVETDLKEPVTIIKWNLRNDDGNILCYYFDGKEEIPYVTGGKDLYIITPEPEMSEFEKALSKCLCDAVVRPEEEDYDKWAKEYAPELLELARQEIENGYGKDLPHVNKFYSIGVRDGKLEAWKDLPRWRIWKDDAGGNSEGHPIAIIKSYGSYKLTNSLGIGGEKYIMLTDLEKLPGFEEEQR